MSPYLFFYLIPTCNSATADEILYLYRQYVQTEQVADPSYTQKREASKTTRLQAYVSTT